MDDGETRTRVKGNGKESTQRVQYQCSNYEDLLLDDNIYQTHILGEP